jgi:hypothetical protein
MLVDPLPVTYNAVVKNLVRVNQDNYGSAYYLEDGDLRFRLSVKHTIPATGDDGESHLCRLDVEHYSAGVYVRTASAWGVIRTDGAIQDSTSSSRAALALQTAMTAGNITKLLSRES